ncbi:MAG: formylglycine-generating enzyme family protein [Bacteroidales bacterium]|nr:formylglycine-generating enzyme family protein [Bacteroidales bacterium]
MKKRTLLGIVAVIITCLIFVSCEKNELVVPEEPTEDLFFNVNGVSFRMVKVEGGQFRMGNEGFLFNVVEDEIPTHNVSLSSFYIGETEVTQELWEALMEDNPSIQSAEDRMRCPVENVSWNDCQIFIERLNEYTGRVFALPTEAQWEFAARGGINNSEYEFSGSNDIEKVGWYENNSPAPRPVKGKEANALKLYDMCGNVAEWCNDWYGIYSSSFQENPLGHHSGTKRVVRGGSWNSPEQDCRNTARDAHAQYYSCSYIGFRLVIKY